MGDQKKPRILMVDDEEAILRVFHRVLAGVFEVVTASSAAQGFMLLEEQAFDVIVTDQQMPGCKGIELLEVAKERFPDVRRILHTGTLPLDIQHHIATGTVELCLTKPTEAKELVQGIRALYETENPRR